MIASAGPTRRIRLDVDLKSSHVVGPDISADWDEALDMNTKYRRERSENFYRELHEESMSVVRPNNSKQEGASFGPYRLLTHSVARV